MSSLLQEWTRRASRCWKRRYCYWRSGGSTRGLLYVDSQAGLMPFVTKDVRSSDMLSSRILSSSRWSASCLPALLTSLHRSIDQKSEPTLASLVHDTMEHCHTRSDIACFRKPSDRRGGMDTKLKHGPSKAGWAHWGLDRLVATALLQVYVKMRLPHQLATAYCMIGLRSAQSNLL